jgi:hypothetical protein
MIEDDMTNTTNTGIDLDKPEALARAADPTDEMLNMLGRVHPFAMPSTEDTTARSYERLHRAFCRQQPWPVPDQACIVWRADLMRMSNDLTHKQAFFDHELAKGDGTAAAAPQLNHCPFCNVVIDRPDPELAHHLATCYFSVSSNTPSLLQRQHAWNRRAPAPMQLAHQAATCQLMVDEQIVAALHSLGVDTYPSKYGFAELQVSATSVPTIRKVVEKFLAIAHQPLTDERALFEAWARKKVGMPAEVPFCWESTWVEAAREGWLGALAQQPRAPTLLNVEEMAALRRFNETCEDGEGYDVRKPMMQRLATIGAVRRTSGSYYEITSFGMHVLGAAPAPAAQAERDDFAIRFIEQRAEQYLQDHADTDPETGAPVFKYGEAGRDYHSTLVELADDLRAAMSQAKGAVMEGGAR